jgi:type III pantothenate kinase
MLDSTKAMLLAIDIGNTNITAGVFDGERLLSSWRLSTDPRRLADEYALQLHGLLPLKGVSPDQVHHVAICSVVPPLTGVFQDAARALWGIEPLVVGTGTRTGVRVLYDSPRDVGADRVVDAAAAFHYYGAPAIVVDFGTATVIDAIGADGSYLGGAIALGLSVAAESLFVSTSQLRRVELVTPKTAIGKSTVHSMQSGLLLGYIGLVESMVSRFKKEMDAPDANVVATGGLAHVMASETDVIDVVDEDLTLRGLQYIYTMNTTPIGTQMRSEA